MAAKILMTGSIMMDLILQMPRIPHPSESLLGTSYSNAGGGKGSNSAVAACKAGGEVSVCGTLGKDSNGGALLGMLGVAAAGQGRSGFGAACLCAACFAGGAAGVAWRFASRSVAALMREKE